MGLLDDAIREHLELKRRRGADPAEVEQQEREALGPVRGAPAAEAPPADAEPLAHDDDLPEPAPSPEPPPLPADPEPAPIADPEPPPREPEPAPASPPEPPVSQPTAQYSVEDLEELRRQSEPAAPPRDVVPADDEPEPEAEAEDVLDETPDFLQEAPEHDRLWFEQRPPRDFDF